MKYAHCWDFYFLFYHIQSSVLWFLNSYVHIPGEIAMRRSSGSWKTGLQASPQVGLFTLYRHAYLFRISHTCMWWLYTISCFRWRLAIRKDLSEKGSAASQKEVSGEDLPAKDEDEDILNEMSELKDIMDAKKKREKKAVAKRKAKVWMLVCCCIYFSIRLFLPLSYAQTDWTCTPFAFLPLYLICV